MPSVTLNRRRATLMLGALAGFGLPLAARAEERYPSRPMKLIVPFPPGGALDAVARALQEPLQQRLGQSLVIDNRPGAGARLATEQVVRAPGDGYTLLITTPASITVARALVPSLSYDPLTDLVSVTRLAELINVMVVPAERPQKTVAEFIDWARQQNRPISFGSSGVGSADHLAGEFFKQVTGLNLQHIPYKGGGLAMTDLATERIDLSFATYAAASSVLASGKIRALAVTTSERTKLLPELPAIGETVKGFGVSNWAGIFIPKGTPPAIRDRLFAELTHVSGMPQVRTIEGRAGADVSLSTSPEDFAKGLREETRRWDKIIKDANIQVE
jgi:tripartite-type tricarboxylate transporter receptor subunit TctC